MRVALLSSYEEWHGGEVVLAAVALGLAERGHAVTLLCRPASAIGERLAGRRGVRVVERRLRGEGDPRTHAAVLGALREAAAEVLLTNLSRDLKFGALAARMLRISHVHRYAEVARRLPRPSDNGAPVARGKRVQRLLLRRFVSGCIAPSRFVRELLLRRAPGAAPVAVVPNGVDARAFRPDREAGLRWRARHGIGEAAPLVGCVGQLDRRRKAQHVLLRACAAAAARPVVAFVGSGRDADSLREEAAELGVEAVLAGFESDTAPAYNAFDVTALPSRQESFGLAVAEAMACGRPVVAAGVGSVPELLRDSVEGWLVPRDDPAALAAALDEAFARPDLRRARGAAARARVERELSIERMVESYEAGLAAARAGSFAAWAAAARGLAPTTVAVTRGTPPIGPAAPPSGTAASAAPAAAPALRRPRSRAKRLRLALRHEPKRLLYPLLGAGGSARREPEPALLAGARRVLLLRELHTLGDAMLATPAVRALAAAFPQFELGLVTGWRNAAVWRHNPRLTRLFVLGRDAKPRAFVRLVGAVREWRPDAVVTLESVTCHATLDVLARLSRAPLRIRYDGAAFGMPHTNPAYDCLVSLSAAAGAHQIELVAGVLRPFGVELVERALELVPGASGEGAADRLLTHCGMAPGAPFAILHPGSKQVHNRWPVERFDEVRRHLVRRGLRALLSFGPSEEPARAWFADRGVPTADLLPPLALEDLAALLARARLAVLPDTGVLHVAAAVGTSVVGLYGSGDPELWRPPGRVRAVSGHELGNVRGIAIEDVLGAVDAELGVPAG